jgi:uncharacterized membrane protein YfcA
MASDRNTTNPWVAVLAALVAAQAVFALFGVGYAIIAAPGRLSSLPGLAIAASVPLGAAASHSLIRRNTVAPWLVLGWFALCSVPGLERVVERPASHLALAFYSFIPVMALIVQALRIHLRSRPPA